MKLTLSLMVWNTSHLLGRTLETLKKQTMQDWELLIVDDMSEDDVPLTIQQHGQGLPIKYHRLEHDMGMRGNTFSLNYGLRCSQGDVVMWSTPEVMLPPGTLQAVYDTLQNKHEKLWVTIPSHGLTPSTQLCLDAVDWKTDLHAIKTLVENLSPEDPNSIWFYVNFYEDGRRDKEPRISYGNNQTVGVRRQQWLENVGYFPYFLDYGSDDPWVSGTRKKNGYQDVTLWEYEAYHQWHATTQYWMALGKAPNWNKWGHTTSNIMSDINVPEGGTCEIWDGGSHEQTPRSTSHHLGAYVLSTGFKEKNDQG